MMLAIAASQRPSMNMWPFHVRRVPVSEIKPPSIVDITSEVLQHSLDIASSNEFGDGLLCLFTFRYWSLEHSRREPVLLESRPSWPIPSEEFPSFAAVSIIGYRLTAAKFCLSYLVWPGSACSGQSHGVSVSTSSLFRSFSSLWPACVL